MYRYLVFLMLLPLTASASIFGEENFALLKLVSGQLMELEHLAEAVGVAKDQRDLLLQINRGIDRTTQEIDAIQEIIDRAQGLDPKAIHRISDITNMIYELKSMKASVEEVVAAKLLLSDQAIAESALQSETAYKMGQEMIGTGAALAIEAKTASPGRASQISASAESAGMLSQGVMLQTLSQMTQLQAMNLELQKSQMEKELYTEQYRRKFFASELHSNRGQVQ